MRIMYASAYHRSVRLMNEKRDLKKIKIFIIYYIMKDITSRIIFYTSRKL